MLRNLIGALVGLAFLAMAGSASATLIGDEVTIESAFNTITSINSTDVVTVGAGAEIACFDATKGACDGNGGSPVLFDSEFIDIGDSSITMSFIGIGFSASDFQGWIFSDLDWVGIEGPGIITGFVIDTNFAGFGVGNVSFGNDFVALNFAGLALGEPAFVTINLIVNHNVPEPGTLALLGAALAGFGFMTRRRRKLA